MGAVRDRTRVPRSPRGWMALCQLAHQVAPGLRLCEDVLGNCDVPKDGLEGLVARPRSEGRVPIYLHA